MASLAEWDSFNRNVQSGLTEGQFMAAQYTLIAAGPPNLTFLTAALSNEAEGSTGNSIVFPMGVTQRFAISQTRQHARVWEIGSERCYWITGRSVGQVALGRIVYHGPNLLRVLYAYYRATAEDQELPSLFQGAFADLANANRNPKNNIRISPGYQNVFLNLASDLFTQPIGMMAYFKDSNDESVFATYLENCIIPSHQLGFDSGGVLIQESVALQFERITPVRLASVVPLVDLDTSGVISTAESGRISAQTGRNF